jgi:hypothetical protein
MIYLLAAPVAVLLAAWLDVFVIGGGVRVAIRQAPKIRAPEFRVRYNHWLPKLLRAVRFGPGDRRNYFVVMGNTLHLSGHQIGVGSLAHEVWHLVREAALGQYRHVWRYITDPAWARAEEVAAEAARELWVRDGTDERRSLDSIAKTINTHGAKKRGVA